VIISINRRLVISISISIRYVGRKWPMVSSQHPTASSAILTWHNPHVARYCGWRFRHAGASEALLPIFLDFLFHLNPLARLLPTPTPARDPGSTVACVNVFVRPLVATVVLEPSVPPRFGRHAICDGNTCFIQSNITSVNCAD
jgi:hypothetical protein